MLMNINKMAEELERQELESSNGIASIQIYSQLLAIYLFQNDLCNAKFLWKRIPPSIKSSNPELSHIWAVGQQMWQRDFPSIYKNLNCVTWSENVADIMKAVQDSIRNRTADMITRAYSSISLEAVSSMTGLTEEQTIAACTERGWSVEPDTKMVHPVPSSNANMGQTSSEDQLYKLTEFVSFLEN